MEEVDTTMLTRQNVIDKQEDNEQGGAMAIELETWDGYPIVIGETYYSPYTDKFGVMTQEIWDEAIRRHRVTDGMTFMTKWTGNNGEQVWFNICESLLDQTRLMSLNFIRIDGVRVGTLVGR